MMDLLGSIVRVSAALIVIGSMAGCAARSVNPWGDVKYPSQGQSVAIGSYSAGCLAGAVSMYPDGRGYQLMRLTRGRFYGHPELIRFIEELGKNVSNKGLGQILVGNLGQPRGGPTTTGHKSHQTGLDVDFWYWQPPFDRRSKLPPRLTLGERERIESPSLVDLDTLTLNRNQWTKQIPLILKATAEMSAVERIFVSAAIKKELCSSYSGAVWLTKVRPWWKHHDHFHVRLRCPADQPQCQAQEAVASGDGCGDDLQWWFSDEARAQAKAQDTQRDEFIMPKLPEACDGVLKSAQ